MRKRQKQGGGADQRRKTKKKRKGTAFVNSGKDRPNWIGESADDREV